ncbi:MAG TPA: molybdate ABC transporter substrate-binding protein [Baekduia sp.]|uniref:molybdate ABC transporter substrate-binding protein n=1 Tax=Baekduia sp. TaxID=2600305 RepID=UPI002C387184|nr:molybdate ABC transporter substrate-binding protein [Baekduia sp.]HMJ37185.1 molybdate ABC transporter substrate-binding protein [Baekduia sp.]
MRRLVVLIILMAAAAVPAGADAALNVYAAASLRNVFPALDGAPSYNFAGSNTLQRQIDNGAPADVFASAEPAEAQALFRAGRCTRPVTFATNILVLLIPKDNPGSIRSAYTLRDGGKRLAIGTAGVPIGNYTRLLLRRMRLSSILDSNIVSQETDVASITAKVALGSADAGFVYHTDALASRGRTSELRLPKWAQPAVRYKLCAVVRTGADTSGAQAFIRKVSSNAGRSALRHYGFGLPPRG